MTGRLEAGQRPAQRRVAGTGQLQGLQPGPEGQGPRVVLA